MVRIFIGRVPRHSLGFTTTRNKAKQFWFYDYTEQGWTSEFKQNPPPASILGGSLRMPLCMETTSTQSLTELAPSSFGGGALILGNLLAHPLQSKGNV